MRDAAQPTHPTVEDVSTLLRAWSEGDRRALEKLMPIVYDELRRLGRRYMRGERPGHSLQTTALVNEAYTRLVDYKRMQWQNRAHFFAVSAQLMRRILVEHARRHNLKRGGGFQHVLNFANRSRMVLTCCGSASAQPDDSNSSPAATKTR